MIVLVVNRWFRAPRRWKGKAMTQYAAKFREEFPGTWPHYSENTSYIYTSVRPGPHRTPVQALYKEWHQVLGMIRCRDSVQPFALPDQRWPGVPIIQAKARFYCKSQERNSHLQHHGFALRTLQNCILNCLLVCLFEYKNSAKNLLSVSFCRKKKIFCILLLNWNWTLVFQA